MGIAGTRDYNAVDFIVSQMENIHIEADSENVNMTLIETDWNI